MGVVGVVPPKLMGLPTSSTPSSLGMVGRPPRQDLVEVVVLERLPLQDEVGEPPADLAEDAASSRRVPYPPRPLPGREVGLHRLHQANRLGVGGHR